MRVGPEPEGATGAVGGNVAGTAAHYAGEIIGSSQIFTAVIALIGVLIKIDMFTLFGIPSTIEAARPLPYIPA